MNKENIIKKINDMYNYNRVLAIGTILFLVVCLSHIISSDWPEWFPHANDYYNFIYDFGLAYISSYIFFILQSYIPNKKKTEKSMNIIRPSINEICRNMEMIIGICDCFVDMSEDRINVRGRDDQDRVYYKFIIYNNGIKEGTQYEYINIVNYFAKYEMNLNKLLEEIKAKTVYKDCDDKLIELIGRLEYNSFPSILKSMKRLINETNICFNNLKGGYKEFKLLNRELEKYNTRGTKYKIESLTKEEMEKYNETLKKFGNI